MESATTKDSTVHAKTTPGLRGRPAKVDETVTMMGKTRFAGNRPIIAKSNANANRAVRDTLPARRENKFKEFKKIDPNIDKNRSRKYFVLRRPSVASPESLSLPALRLAAWNSGGIGGI
jgi:hypothetical protein